MKQLSTAFLAPMVAYVHNNGNERAYHHQHQASIAVDDTYAAPLQPSAHVVQHITSSSATATATALKNPSSGQPLSRGVMEWLVPSASAASTPEPPTNAEVELLRRAFAALYNEGGSPEEALPILDEVVTSWSRQPADEKAGVYRVRADCHMRLLQMEEAVKDYSVAIDLLDGPGGDVADPAEKPAAHLGRARAIMSVKGSNPMYKTMADKAAKDYATSLLLSSREDWDTDEENIEDGAQRNPYAAWEMGIARRSAGDFKGAYDAHKLASDSFENIGDHARAVISLMDAGIDLAAIGDVSSASKVLEAAIKSSVGVESRDVDLLERVVAKEGEARISLASLYWANNQKQKAETLLGDACVRLDQLESDSANRKSARKQSNNKSNEGAGRIQMKIEDLGYGIDDVIPQGGEISCSRFKNEKFLDDVVRWPKQLKDQAKLLQKFS